MVVVEKFSRFVVTSAALHLGLFALVFIVPSLLPVRTLSSWGSNTSTDGGVKVAVVESLPGIPLPSPPVVHEDAAANDTKSLYAAEPAPKPVDKVEPAPEVLIPSNQAKTPKEPPAPKPEQKTEARTETKATPAPPNAVATPGGGQAALPFGQGATGTGPATFGDGTFGQRFGDYVDRMSRAISDKWRDNIAGIRRGAAPRVYVSFTIARNGSVSDLEIAQGSGVDQLDTSALRAVRSAQLPPLPREYAGSSVTVRFYFEYVR